MLIGICGSRCAGKQSVADFLIEKYGFQQLYLNLSPNLNGVQPYGFDSITDLLAYSTRNWRTNCVTTHVFDEDALEQLSQRPFFLLISVDAPVSVRWSRFKSRDERRGFSNLDLERFLAADESLLYGRQMVRLMHRAELRLINASASISLFRDQLAALELPNERRLRPDWDQYFMQLASLAAHRSNCMKRSVGCVLVRDRRVISTGYNGTARNMLNCNEGGCPRCNRGDAAGTALSTCLCIHAEENALLEAGRDRIPEGTVLYCDTCPCLTCSIKIVQVGISEVVYRRSYSMDVQAARVLEEGRVKLRQYSPPKRGLVHLGKRLDSGDIMSP